MIHTMNHIRFMVQGYLAHSYSGIENGRMVRWQVVAERCTLHVPHGLCPTW